MNKKTVIFILFVLIGFNLSANYDQLREYKTKTKSITQNYLVLQNTRQYYIVNFKDLNKMDTDKLEKEYALKLYQCIADGICIFKFKNFKIKPLDINNIVDKETNIIDIQAYKPYHFQTF